MTEGDRALDYEAVSRELATLGLTREDGSPYTERQVRRMAEDHKLPFFKTPGRRRMIMRSVLFETVAAWQVTARREMSAARAEAAKARQPKRRA